MHATRAEASPRKSSLAGIILRLSPTKTRREDTCYQISSPEPLQSSAKLQNVQPVAMMDPDREAVSPSHLQIRSPSLASDTGPASSSWKQVVSPSPASTQFEMRGISIMSYPIKQLVSKEKRRFEEDGFNLDLTYVTNRLIAFGYPAESFEGIYRNHYKDVYNFFEKRHGDKYKIYNLCSERNYDKVKFHYRVAEYPFDDHCPPPLALLLAFCRDVDQWLAQDPEHVAAVHCKAGKGRTGVMMCSFLLYKGIWKTAYGALAHFAAARSLKREGVTIPSQRRFVAYFAAMCRGMAPLPRDVNLEYGSVELQGGNELEQREHHMPLEDYHQFWESMVDGKCSPLSQITPILPSSKPLVLVMITIDGVYKSRPIDPRIRIKCCTLEGIRNHPSRRFSSKIADSEMCYDLPCLFTTAQAEVSHVPTSATNAKRSPITSNPYVLRQGFSIPPKDWPSSAPTTPRRSDASPYINSLPKQVEKKPIFFSTQQPSPEPSQASRSASVVSMAMKCKRVLVYGECKISLHHRSGKAFGQFWIHTSFINLNTLTMRLKKHEIDEIARDAKKGHRKYSPAFSITLHFEEATDKDKERMSLGADNLADLASSSRDRARIHKQRESIAMTSFSDNVDTRLRSKSEQLGPSWEEREPPSMVEIACEIGSEKKNSTQTWKFFRFRKREVKSDNVRSGEALQCDHIVEQMLRNRLESRI
uniref:Phosphatidylinositol3 putative n=1 Tax=Albugo laibachii Nc14 TaxID=890382 RepID=F0WDD2_9STRA|nr:phosphatidylinositol3 putative [Albugo laibachii Nc14]|eukprot:CCA19204.1 phosphatidylinositol3 putative [Albugo laibachii Nc14]